MKTVSDWIDSCSKEQLKTYQEWFNLADSGFASSLHFILHFLSDTTNSFVFDRRRRWPHHWKWCNQILCSLQLISLSTQAGIYFFYVILLFHSSRKAHFLHFSNSAFQQKRITHFLLKSKKIKKQYNILIKLCLTSYHSYNTLSSTSKNTQSKWMNDCTK